MTRGSIGSGAKGKKMDGSAAADRDDDFQAVAAGKRGTCVLAARDDFAILFDGDAFSRQIERLDQSGHGERRREAAGFAVDDQFNHNFFPGISFSMMPNSTPLGHEYPKETDTARASYSGIT